jgi:RHS repeat-associated protein
MLQQTVNGQTTSYAYNATNNELKSSTGPAGTLSYTYDQDGNPVRKTVGSTGWNYTRDGAGDLVKVSENSVRVGSYGYDGLGRRVESVESSTVFYAYYGTETLYEYNMTGRTSNDYVYAGDLRLFELSGTTTNYYFEDALGNVRLVTNASGGVVFTDGYQPYGQNNGTPTGSQDYRYTGKPVSQTTGLYYEYSRWYDPSLGRFISRDPLSGVLSDPQSLNPYVYVQNSPTVLTDPTGAAAEGAGCFGGLCEGPAPTVNLCAVVAGYCNPVLCAENPFICGGWSGDADNGGGDTTVASGCQCSETGGLGDAGDGGVGLGDNSGGSGSPLTTEPGTTTVAVSDAATPTISDANPTTGGTGDVEFLDPNSIRFTQDSISPRFQNGKFIPDVAEGLRSGDIDPASIDPIRVVDMNDRLYSLDNRRLAAYQMAGVDVPVERVSLSDPAIAAKFADAYTTPWWVDGRWVYIRGWFIWPP